jgi:sodium pump decarboxylase gamma subunit
MVAVMLTGMVVVFLALIVLILIVTLLGKVFDNLNNKKKNELAPTKTTSAPAPVKTTPAPTKVAPVAIAQPSEDEDEIIAVISSAVAMMSLADGKNYRVKSVKAVKGTTSGRPAWSMAGLRENTRPFRH